MTSQNIKNNQIEVKERTHAINNLVAVKNTQTVISHNPTLFAEPIFNIGKIGRAHV